MGRRERMCLSKDAFWSGHYARKRAAEITRSGNTMHAYRCPYCKQWHLGHAS